MKVLIYDKIFFFLYEFSTVLMQYMLDFMYFNFNV